MGVVAVPLGTPDLTAQMQQVADGGAGVVHILGNDAFCISAIQGLLAVGYDGAISGVSHCFTDGTRTALGGDLEGISVLAPLADGATDDPTYQLYLAVMAEYGEGVDDVDGYYALSGYAAVATLAAAVETIEGDVSAETVATTIKAMPETELPAGGGVTFRCGGSAVPDQPAICTNQWLRGELDASGEVSSYTVEDSPDVVG
jgi:branched-chain amino acid transport system substrate-binding protein